MPLPQIGGDSPNTTPVAIQSGLAAQKLAKPMMDAAKAEGATKLPWDKFVSTVKNQTAANAPLADAMQQQSFFVKWAQKIPGIGPRITSWLGPDAIVNNAISSMGKDALGKVNPAEVTRIVYQGGDVAKNLVAAGVPAESAKSLAQAGAERIAAMGGKEVVQQAATQATEQAAKGLSGEAIQNILNGAKNGGVLAGKNVTAEAIQNAVKNGGDDVVGALRQLGLRADAAKQIATEATKGVAQTGAKQAATQTAEKAVETTAKSSGIKGFFGKLLGGAKGNFIISGIFSLGSNAIQLAQGKMNIKQFVALTASDTLAYGAIGLGASAAGGAIAGAIGQALIPIPGLGFIVGLGLGMLGGMLYEKLFRNKVKDMLGGGAGAQTPYTTPTSSNYTPSDVGPGEYQDPYAQQPTQGQGAPAQQPTSSAPAPTSSGDMTYDQAMQYLNSMPQQ